MSLQNCESSFTINSGWDNNGKLGEAKVILFVTPNVLKNCLTAENIMVVALFVLFVLRIFLTCIMDVFLPRE